MKIYKIKDTKTGLYSPGGNYSRWDKDGKKFKTIQSLQRHIKMFNNLDPERYKNAVIEEYELVLVNSNIKI